MSGYCIKNQKANNIYYVKLNDSATHNFSIRGTKFFNPNS